MGGQVTIPLWLFILMAVITLWWMLDRILAPGVRWFFRRKINRVITEIGARLDIEIRPFQLTKRQVLIDRLVYDPRVMEAVLHFAEKEGKPRDVIQEEVDGYAREIVPSFNAYFYFRVGYWLAQKLARLLYRVRVGLFEDESLTEVDPKSTVVFVMNHRSNMDYILVAFLAAERTTLSYAVGEWARIWPLESLIKFMGAFFVRRNSGNPLYRLVLERYINMATREGVCQAVFLEGGLSRDGRLRPPKYGLIDYMLRSYDPESDRDIVFIPVGLNYDRTLEDRSLLLNLDPRAGKPGKWFAVKTTVGFVWHNIVLMSFGKWQRFGYACVNFGRPVSAGRYCRENGFAFSRMDKYERYKKVEDFSRELMRSIEGIVPVLPLSLTALVLLDNRERFLSGEEIVELVRGLREDIEVRGAPVFYPGREYDQAVRVALGMLKLRRLVVERDGLFKADPAEIIVLDYYANSMKYWLENRDPGQASKTGPPTVRPDTPQSERSAQPGR